MNSSPAPDTQVESRSRAAVRRLVERRWFQRSVIALIIVNAVILGMETYQAIMARHGHLLEQINFVIVAVFEAPAP